MNKDLLESQWTQIREILREKFSNLSDEDIRQINGRYDQLVAKLQQKYGYTREEAEERIRSWNFDRFTTAPKSQTIREESYRTEPDSNFFKWLLALGIPLLLLGAYYLGNRTPEITNAPPPVVQQQAVRETPSDRLISDNIRNALLAVQGQNTSFNMRNIQVTTNDGVVTLSGSVPSAEIRDSIVNAVQNFGGVKQVINNLQVK